MDEAPRHGDEGDPAALPQGDYPDQIAKEKGLRVGGAERASGKLDLPGGHGQEQAGKVAIVGQILWKGTEADHGEQRRQADRSTQGCKKAAGRVAVDEPGADRCTASFEGFLFHGQLCFSVERLAAVVRTNGRDKNEPSPPRNRFPHQGEAALDICPPDFLPSTCPEIVGTVDDCLDAGPVERFQIAAELITKAGIRSAMPFVYRAAVLAKMAGERRAEVAA